IDLGGSQTKVIASVPESRDSPILLCMEPEIADVSAASVRNYEKTKSGEVDPENACCSGFNQKDSAVAKTDIVFCFRRSLLLIHSTTKKITATRL
ncbi:MAG: hypothetical protein PUP93_32560, partial [Rhizonema sp. NSF051]|nr:hypothetical protein [Rhizonema sp. NSF051]